MSSRRYLSISVVLIKLRTNSRHSAAEVTSHNTAVYGILSHSKFQICNVTFFLCGYSVSWLSWVFSVVLHAYMESEVTSHK